MVGDLYVLESGKVEGYVRTSALNELCAFNVKIQVAGCEGTSALNELCVFNVEVQVEIIIHCRKRHIVICQNVIDCIFNLFAQNKCQICMLICNKCIK